MLPQQKKGWTTVVDIEEFKKMTWTYLTNIKTTWEYDGMAYAFRRAGIPLYGKDCGTLKMNHPILTMPIPQSRDKNYGVDIYVPVEMKRRAEKIISVPEKLKQYAELEAVEGKAAREEFDRAAREAKERNERRAREDRRARRRAMFSRLKRGAVAGGE